MHNVPHNLNVSHAGILLLILLSTTKVAAIVYGNVDANGSQSVSFLLFYQAKYRTVARA